MKKGLLAIALLVASTVFAAVTLWTNDKAHSQLQFTVTHLGLSDVSGTFNDFDVKVSATKEDFSDAVFELTAKAASIDTRVEARNNHLKSADFFDVEKYPEITYKSTAIKKKGKNKYKLTGDLTIHGVTKSVTMDLVYRGKLVDEETGKETVGFQLTGEIKRSDFNVGPGFPEPMISDLVRIKADGEFVKQ
ncbi:YceI family protein [Parapedobacter soli]|uniref:YceI family protein n=1 Tax=Parapedobacter soli TaxID=416955 RepID=UPI0021C87801|nr:YceI family protein [Parapedobacter soli]